MSSLRDTFALGRTWSLRDMLRFNAVAFYEAMANLGGIQAVMMTAAEFAKKLDESLNLKSSNGPTTPIEPNAIKMAQSHLGNLHKELGILGTSLTAISVRRLIVKLLDEKPPTEREFLDAVHEISSRLKDELSSVYTLVISEDRAKYFEPKEPLFGQDVNDKLPLAIPDIEDAGKCIAVNQGTAAVFHLIRVMEAALKSLATMLGIPYAPSWESYIKQINDKIAAKHKTKGVKWKKDEAFYREILGDLQTIKIAWRNPTMHIVRRYSTDEAEEIFRAVRGFLIRLAPKLPKPLTRTTVLVPSPEEQSS